MLETTVLDKVDEAEQNRVITHYQYFGWHVLNTQKIDYTTSYETGGGNAKTGYNYTVHNDRTAYYTITFQRDTNMEHYAELTALFDEYKAKEGELDSLYYDLKKAKPVQSRKKATIFIIIGCLTMWLLVGIGLAIYGCVLWYRKPVEPTPEQQAIQKKIDECHSELNAIAMKAKNIALSI